MKEEVDGERSHGILGQGRRNKERRDNFTARGYLELRGGLGWRYDRVYSSSCNCLRCLFC